MKTDSDRDLHKQPFEDVLQNRCSKKSHNIHRKTLVLESPTKMGQMGTRWTKAPC